MNKYYSLLLVAIFLLSYACGDDDGDVQEPGIAPIGECHYLFDQNGQAIGVQGTCTGISHWEEKPLIDKERDWFLFENSLEYSDMHGEFSSLIVQAYPIPAQSNGVISFQFFATGEENTLSNLKLVMIDESETVRFRYVQTFMSGSNTVYIPLDDFTTGQSYRIYYQIFSAENTPYFEGYGDFFVCDDYPPLNYDACL